ncbi:MAG: hypothetical protein KC620_20785 [Myxococcales bacterium]|nr:hypothetical protein [Myxococcales bacterium]
MAIVIDEMQTELLPEPEPERLEAARTPPPPEPARPSLMQHHQHARVATHVAARSARLRAH